MKRSCMMGVLCTCIISFGLIVNTAIAGTISIDPRNTYVLTDNDLPGDAIPILLSDHGISAGDTIEIGLFGDWDNGPDGDTFDGTSGIFSSSATLLAFSNLNRVVDAIDAGVDIFTSNTLFGNISTDVPEDFEITDGLIIDVPTGATHLFVQALDVLYTDNSDPDNDYAISLQQVPIPSAAWLFVSGLLGLIGISRHKKAA
jgi:hypothetical protein